MNSNLLWKGAGSQHHKEGPDMGQQGVPDATRQKPCLCQVRAVARVMFIPTGGVNAKGQSQFKCRVCGATEWR
jgi:hypothetical protein